MHTDIKQEGWVLRHLPPFLRPYGVLARIDRPIGIWLLLLPGWWSIVLAAGGIARMNGNDWKIFRACDRLQRVR
jgi:4-hydroxybenzoate polyprenyltransferase